MADSLAATPTAARAADPASAAAFDDALAAVWQHHRARVLERVAVLELTLAALAEAQLDEPLRAQAEQAAHQLSGTVGTFGFAAASEAAGALELELVEPDAERLPAMRALLASVRGGLRAAV